MLNSTVMGLSLAALLIALTLWVWRTNRRAALVVVCHNAIWGAALVLVATNLIRYDEASPTAWAVLTVALIMFNVGAVISGFLRFRGGSETHRDASLAMTVPPLSLMGRRTFFVLFALYIAAFFAYLAVQWARVGEFALLFDASALRDIDGVSNLEATPVAIRALFYLGPILFAVLAFKEGMKIPLPGAFRFVGALLVLGTMVALLQRTNLFFSVLIWLGLLATRHFGTVTSSAPATGPSETPTETMRPTTRRTFSPVKLVSIALVAVLLMFGTFQVLAVALDKNGSQALSSGNVSPVLANSGLTSFFTYFTGGVPAFLQLVDSNDSSRPSASDRPAAGEYNPLLLGASTFGPVVRFVPGFQEWNPIEPFIDMGIAINVYTWNGPIYRDFRVVGVGIAMFLAGAIISFLHAERYRSARIFWLQAVLLAGVFLSTFLSVIQWGNIVIFFYVAIFALTWKRRGRAVETPPLSKSTDPNTGSASS
jgi:hypothetical protein